MDYAKIIEAVIETKDIVLNEKLRNEVFLKGKADFVTSVDLGISDALKKRLNVLTPEYGFMCEEENDVQLSDPRWILDPIDGTTNLVYNYMLSSISLALLKDGEIVFGVVYNPFNEELFYAEKGGGAYHNGKLMPIADDRKISDCLIEFGAGSSRKNESKEIFKLAQSIFVDCLDIRRMCSSALAISYIACGRLNGYFEKRLKPWDFAAASLILSECGGIITDFNGNPASFDKEGSFIAATPKAHAYLLEKLGKIE